MTEAFKFFNGNSLAAILVGAALLLLALAVTVLCLIAFVQGRSITFWPPAIGERPAAHELPATPPVINSPPTVTTSAISVGSQLKAVSETCYKVTATFYTGSQSTIFKATDPANALVIAKVFWDGLIPDSQTWHLLQREQRASEILQHQNVIRTLDRGLSSGYPFTIMEYLAGGTLRDCLSSHHRLPAADVLSIARQVADAIDYAHSQGVLHRDIKPGNILLEQGPQQRVVLSDFGIASILLDAQNRNTAVAGFRGSPAYLAPELLKGDPPAEASDIYSFATVMFEMIAGVVPFRSDQSVYALMHQKLDSPAPDIRTLRRDIPEEVATALAQALSRDVAARPPSARSLIAAIEKPLRTLNR